MQTLRIAILAGLLLAVASLTAHGQTTTPVLAGSTFSFDHDLASVEDTAGYQLCVDTVSDATCTDLAVKQVASPVAGMAAFTFTLPATVGKGVRGLSVRAVGKYDLGNSPPSNVVTVRVVGLPGPPTNFREGQP